MPSLPSYQTALHLMPCIFSHQSQKLFISTVRPLVFVAFVTMHSKSFRDLKYLYESVKRGNMKSVFE